MKWAQRVDKVFITVLLPDAKDAKVKLEPDGVFSFSASAGAENHHYELKLDLFDKVNVEVIICLCNLKYLDTLLKCLRLYGFLFCPVTL